MNTLLQIDAFIMQLGKYGLLGLISAILLYLCYYFLTELEKSRAQRLEDAKLAAKEMVDIAVENGKKDHDENKILIEELKKKMDSFEEERKEERIMLFEMNKKMILVVEENTQALNAIKDKL